MGPIVDNQLGADVRAYSIAVEEEEHGYWCHSLQPNEVKLNRQSVSAQPAYVPKISPLDQK